MPGVMIVRGLNSVRQAFMATQMKIDATKLKAVDKVALKIRDHARKRSLPKDTGALWESIHTEIESAQPTLIIENIIAGDPNVNRGAGRFIYDKHGFKASLQPTLKYVEIIESKRGYMSEAYQWGSAKAYDLFAKYVREELRMI